MQRVDDDVMPSAPIQLLPFELLLQMFKLCISNDTPVRDLISLALVCKLWRSIVEGTSSLWCCISGGEAVPHVRKALAMAKDASLEIIYFEDIARTDPEIFFGEIGRLITQWESLSITTGNSNSPVTALQTNPPPNLKTLHLRAPWYWEWKKGPVTLFEGEPAPLALTDLWVDQIPVVMEPLRLSGLRSLELNRTPVVSAGELLRVLRDSPALERCGLYDLTSLKEFPLPGPEKELLRFQGVENPNIRLSDLRTLALCGLPVSFVHLVLSAIQIPNLQRLDMDCKIDQHGQSPASDLFTTHISHHSPTFTALTDSAKNIQIISFSDTNWTISVGNLIITLEGLAFKLKHLDEGLEWLFSHLGGHVDTLPVNLSLHELEISSKWFTRLASALKVTKLELWTASSSEHEPERQPRNIISLLSQPLESTPTQQWVLPDLESLNTNVVHEDGKSKILDMVKARHAFIETQLDGTQEADVVLKPFKEIRLRGGRNGISKDLAPNTKFLVALQKEARGAEIWWEEFKWTGSEDLNAATKSNEAGSGRVVAG
ncbi:hypothetical protein M407DRAFT_223077 [Tulasnella calospora MUT 4182]|uniref:F-box domain-containing protein n=1 Tax=Tulasnella calospora MUT 4182 TaxID=1051891 RepID=A0A0C3LDA4_9AGAM|nr:hypothetical protein M407DRAFT_223077 [Tulasnella calospora MUT 4182]